MNSLNCPEDVINHLIEKHKLKSYFQLNGTADFSDSIDLPDKNKRHMLAFNSSSASNTLFKKYDLVCLSYIQTVDLLSGNFEICKQYLSDKGIFVIRHTNPKTLREGAPNIRKGTWFGEAYKLACMLRCDEDYTIVTLKMHSGMTIVFQYKDNNNLEDDIPEFDEFACKRNNYLSLISASDYDAFYKDWLKYRDKPIENAELIDPNKVK